MNPESMERAKSEQGGRESVSSAVVTASVVSERDQAAYTMFEARDISPDGAFLAGSLLLELNEEFTVELSLGETAIRTRARVASLAQGEAPGMVIVFSELSDDHRALLERAKDAATQD